MLKFLHIFLAVTLLSSSTGVTVFEHLCQMQGRKIALFSPPKGCCQKKVKAAKSKCVEQTCDNQLGRHTHYKKKPCCKNNSQLIKSNIPGSTLEPQCDILFHPACLPVFSCRLADIYAIIPLNQKILRFYLYKPPPRILDIRVLIQSFIC
jgi:hypothetical protein